MVENTPLAAFERWVDEGWSPGLNDLPVMALGLVGEAGEVTEIIKKHMRGDGPVSLDELELELGDVLHYWCRLVKYFGLDAEEIMAANIAKIEMRRGKRRVHE